MIIFYVDQETVYDLVFVRVIRVSDVNVRLEGA
jgi:hypothetical protein